uniref:Leucine-rich repeat-containing N-terminal plant-type domain-containing protein n=1 Tax=Arundo donax TaxID=35708 RepID=A0A0A9E087_ARUDO
MAFLGVFTLGLVWLLCISTTLRSLPLAICSATEYDRQALLCFKSQTSGPTEVFTSWSNASLEFCNWNGVPCSARSPRRVIKSCIRRHHRLHATLHCQPHLSYKAPTVKQ